MAMVIDGKAVAARIRDDISREVAHLAKTGIRPGLAVILVSDDPASTMYVSLKDKACRDVGIASYEHRLPEKTTETELLDLVDRLNDDPDVDGILVQLPLPKHIDSARILDRISPTKDVDGFHPVNIGKLVTGKPLFRPCTPFGIMILLKEAGVDLAGKDVVVVGRSNIVGKPVALMCLRENATVTLCHSKTVDLAAKVARADVVIAAVGSPEIIKGAWIKEGAVVIDVGINRVGHKKVVGDVEFVEAAKRASAITPVPGGVGPMTITMLLYNTLQAAKNRPMSYLPGRKEDDV